MDGPIQNVSPYIINGWPNTDCFSICITWMAPYRIIFLNVLNGWPHTEWFTKHTK